MSLWEIAQFALGVIVLIVGAEVMVRGASRLAAAVGISPLIIGLTVVAFGTSSPELAVSIQSGLQGQADLALGNIVGSNIFNVLFILGLSAAITPLIVAQQLVRLDVPLLIAVSLITYLFAGDGRIAPWEGVILLAGIVAYTVFMIWESRREPATIQEEYAHEYGVAGPKNASGWLLNATLIVIGLVMLVWGSRQLVAGAVAIAQKFGVSELVIGLTIVAAGTSLPEVATSVIAAIRGERDIAVGNVVGSCLFNLLAVLGMTALVSGNGIGVPLSALRFDLPLMVIVAVACLPIFFTGNTISRWEGLIFLGYYLGYTTYLVLHATDAAPLPVLQDVVLFFLAPLTLLTILVTVASELHARRRGGSPV